MEVLQEVLPVDREHNLRVGKSAGSTFHFRQRVNVPN